MSGAGKTWESTWAPFPGLLADLLDLACASDSGRLARAYCFLAALARAPRDPGPDEAMIGAAGDALLAASAVMRRRVQGSVDHADDAAWVRANHPSLAAAAGICARLGDLMGEAAKAAGVRE